MLKLPGQDSNLDKESQNSPRRSLYFRAASIMASMPALGSYGQ